MYSINTFDVESICESTTRLSLYAELDYLTFIFNNEYFMNE